MQIVIVGGGAIGLIMAAYLTRSGLRPVLVARPERARLIRESGLTVTGLAEFPVELDIRATGEPLPDPDFLVFTTKTYDLAQAVQEHAHLRPRLAAAIQNGVGKERLLQAAFGAAALGGTTFIGGTVEADTRVRHSVHGTSVFGPIAGSGSEHPDPAARDSLLAAVATSFDGAGLPCLVSPAVAGLIWSKQAIQAAMVTLAVATGAYVSDILMNPDLARVALLIMKDVLRVAAHRQLPFTEFPDWGFAFDALLNEPDAAGIARLQAQGRRMAAHGESRVSPSLVRDLRAGRRTETDDTIGAALAEAQRSGVATPHLEQAYWLVKGIAGLPRS